jgi:hypothetical protein
MSTLLVVVINTMAVTAAGVNLYMLWESRRRLRRQVQLEIMLSQLCMDAFLYQHLPIWSPWCTAFGYTFSVKVNPVEHSHEPH